MSIVRLNSIWQHDKVLPYLFGELKEKIEAITPIEQIYLFGSRAKIQVENWHQLDGKDWDILVIGKFPIINTHVWTWDKNYNIDLKITGPDGRDNFIKYNLPLIELYPENKLAVELEKLLV